MEKMHRRRIATVFAGQEIEAVAARYNTHIHEGAKLLPKARSKIRTRLNTYTVADLIKAIDHFSNDPWWMEHNRERGMGWFFNSDERIEQFINLIQQPKKITNQQATCPEHGPGSMRREAWAGKLVLKCQQCEFAYRTEALWTERPQEWEKTLGK